jgi:hypothetical protein
LSRTPTTLRRDTALTIAAGGVSNSMHLDGAISPDVPRPRFRLRLPAAVVA